MAAMLTWRRDWCEYHRSRIGRATQGVTLMKVNRGERVVSMALVDSTQDNGHDGAAVEDLELIAQS